MSDRFHESMPAYLPDNSRMVTVFRDGRIEPPVPATVWTNKDGNLCVTFLGMHDHVVEFDFRDRSESLDDVMREMDEFMRQGEDRPGELRGYFPDVAL